MLFFPCSKINLGLSVVSKRTDGYHNIESVFYPVDLCDVVEIHKDVSTQIIELQATPSANSLEDNLLYKAWKIMRDHHDISPVKIYLKKNIPSGAGLGGGSSDASHMLLALNDYFKLNLSQKTLFSYAQTLGSDCSFFIHKTPCFVQGIGHHLEPVSPRLTGLYVVIVHPGIHISTALAYQAIKPSLKTYSIKKVYLESPLDQWRKSLENDFELAIFNQYPALLEVKNILYQRGAIYASMSGSGSAIYGVFEKDPWQDLQNLWPNCFKWIGKLL